MGPVDDGSVAAGGDDGLHRRNVGIARSEIREQCDERTHAKIVYRNCAIKMVRFETRPQATNRLLIFARVPERGRVKTRLASDLGEDRALALYQAMLQDLLDAVGRSDEQTAVEIVWTASPNVSGGEVRRIFSGFELSTQCGPTLGERLLLAFHERIVFYRSEKVIAIGTDDPTITREMIDTAFGLLDSCDWVIGPASDGGYYLIGCRSASFHISVFENIDWSTPTVLADTLSKLKGLQETVALLPTRTDLDLVDDVRAFSRTDLRSAARTREVLRDWGWVA